MDTGDQSSAAADPAPLSDAQAAVYDRQLRVWGVEVQNRLSAARVLIAGGAGLAAETAKNLVLAGIGHLALMDDTPCQQASQCNFLVPSTSRTEADSSSTAQASVNTLQAMNPLVKVTCEAGPPTSLSAAVLGNYDLVLLAHDPGTLEAARLDDLCSELGVLLLLAVARGPLGFFFVNLHRFQYTLKGKGGPPAPAGSAPASPLELQCASWRDAMSVPLAKMTQRTHPLHPVLRVVDAFERRHLRLAGPGDVAALQRLAVDMATDDRTAVPGPGVAQAELLEQFVACVGPDEELAPMCAILGGLLSNTVVRAVSHVGLPLKSLFFYTLFDSLGVVEDVAAGC